MDSLHSQGRGRGRGRGRGAGGASGAGAGAGGATEPGLVVKKTMSAAERAKAVAEWQADGEPGGLKEL